MSSVPTILLLTRTPAFFEHPDVWFNRRGVDVFCARNIPEATTILKSKPVHLVICANVPPQVNSTFLRQFVPSRVPVLFLKTDSDSAKHATSFLAKDNCCVLSAPFGQRLSDHVAHLLAAPTRHYLRLLVHFQRCGSNQPVSFGFTANLSTTGLLLDTRCSASIGETLKLSFLLPGSRETTTVNGVVVRHSTTSNGDTHQYGLKFMDLPAHSRRTILELTHAIPERREAVGG